MGRGRLWGWDGGRFWRRPGGRGSADRPRCSGSREGNPPAAPSSALSPLPAAEGPSQHRPRAPCIHPAFTRPARPPGRAGPRRMDLRGAVQTGRMSSYFFMSIPLEGIMLEDATHHLMWSHRATNLLKIESGDGVTTSCNDVKFKKKKQKWQNRQEMFQK